MLKWIIAVVVVGAVLAFVWGRSQAAVLVESAGTQRTAISAYIEERGRTRLPRTELVTMPIAGRILPIELDEGDRVQAGAIVARLEAVDLDSEVARAEAHVRRLEAQIVENNDARLELSLLDGLEHELVAIDRTVEASQAKTEASEARQSFRATNRERLETAFGSSAATQKEVDDARMDDLQSRVDYRTDLLTLRALEAIRRAAQIGPVAVRQFIEKKSLSEAVLAQDLVDARAALDRSRRDRARGLVASPIDGVVLARAVSSTQVLPAGEVLLEIGDVDRLELEADVLSDEAVAIAVGDQVDIFGPAIGADPVQGIVGRIEPRGFTKVSSLGVEQQRVRVIIQFDEGARLGIFFEDGILVPPLAGAVLFGWCSGLFAIVLAGRRNRFISQSRIRQRWFALTIWFIHFVALVLFFLFLAQNI